MDQIRADLEARLRADWRRPQLEVGELEPVAEGHSGFTYWVDVADSEQGGRYVLRLSPPGARPAGPADVARQGRIMSALNRAGMPTPRIPAMSAEPVIDGRPFVLMARIEGERIETAAAAQDQRALAASAIATLKRLQSVPVGQTGIGEEDPMPLQGELWRWGWLMQRAAPDLTERAPELGVALAQSLPAERAPTLVHADYHMGNMLFRGSEIAAVLDWEIAEIGQPLIDLGCLAVMVARRRFGTGAAPGGTLDLEMGDFLDLYEVEEQEMRWYLGFSLYKYAAILGYNLMLHRKGRRPDPMYEQESMYRTISGMIDDGVELMSGKDLGV